MPLNNKVISDFVKVTNNTKKDKKEKIVYGSISHYDEKQKKYYVKIDGSTTVTPVSCFTTSVNQDQRVIVMIKNHEAVITGNVDSPSTNESYVGSYVDTKLDDLSSVHISDINDLWKDYFS